MSISSGYTVGSYMLENIDGDVCLDVQKEDAYYDGIGKEKLIIVKCLYYLTEKELLEVQRVIVKEQW